MYINGSGFFINPEGGPNPNVTIGSRNGIGVGLDLLESTSKRIVIVNIPPSPDSKTGWQTIYLENFPDGGSIGHWIELPDVFEYLHPAK